MNIIFASQELLEKAAGTLQFGFECDGMIKMVSEHNLDDLFTNWTKLCAATLEPAELVQ